MSNQFIKDKDRAEVEDSLKQKFGIPVRIFDRTWIVERVISNGHVDLAVQSLEIQNVSHIELPKSGPRDFERAQQLEELEIQIEDQSRYSGVELQLIEDCIEAALLARGLGKPRTEVDGRFDRAIRMAKKYGTQRHQLRAAYSHAWSTYWWFDDADVLNQQYPALELLVDYGRAEDLEYLSNLLLALRGAVVHKFITPADAKIEKKWGELNDHLKKIESDETRPGNALIARTNRLVHEVHYAVGDAAALERICSELVDILNKGKSHLDFPILRTLRLVKELDGLIGDTHAYENLFDLVVSTTQESASDKRGGALLLERAFKLRKSGRAYESLKAFGRAQELLTSKESLGELLVSLIGCGSVYFEKGLLWAARVQFIFVLERAVSEFWKEGPLDVRALLSLKKLVWIELLLGRVPVALVWIELLNILERQATLSEEALEDHNEERTTQDFVLGLLVLRSGTHQLESISTLPGISKHLGLFATETASLFALGHFEKLKDQKIEENGDGGRAFFEKWINQPAGKELKRDVAYLDEKGLTLSTKLLGCELSFEIENSIASIVLAETMLGVLEGMFASSIDGSAFPHRSKIGIRIQVELSKSGLPSIDLVDEGGQSHFKVTYGGSLEKIYREESRTEIRDWLLEAAWKIFLSFAILEDSEKFVETIIKDERALSRALAFSDLWIMYSNILGKDWKFRNDDWVRSIKPERLDVARKVAWADNFASNRPDSEDHSEIELKPGTGEVPQELLDVEGARHDGITVESVIDIKEWDKAKWNAILYLVHPSEPPPVLALGFRNIESGRNIFRGWKNQFGDTDKEEIIRISIVKGIATDAPLDYGLSVTTNFDALKRLSPKAQIVFVSRNHRMTPTSSENLDRFIASYKRFGYYLLAPAKMDSDPISDINQFGIRKTKIELREAWQIGDHDQDMMLLDVDSRPLIPSGVVDPPVLKALARLKEFKARM